MAVPPKSKSDEKPETPKAVVTLAQQRDQLLQSPEGVLHIHLIAPEDAYGENAGGDTFSNRRSAQPGTTTKKDRDPPPTSGTQLPRP